MTAARVIGAGSIVPLRARLAYLPIYAAGIPYLRTAAWAVSLVGVIKVLWALF